MDYMTKNNIIIFAPKFNKELDVDLLSNYNKIIFSDYILDDDLFEEYENNIFENIIFKYCKYIKSKFNNPVNMLLNSITHLTFGYCFNKLVNMLLNSITHLTFDYNFNLELNNLPNSIKKIIFNKINNYDEELNNLPYFLEHL